MTNYCFFNRSLFFCSSSLRALSSKMVSTPNANNIRSRNTNSSSSSSSNSNSSSNNINAPIPLPLLDRRNYINGGLTSANSKTFRSYNSDDDRDVHVAGSVALCTTPHSALTMSMTATKTRDTASSGVLKATALSAGALETSASAGVTGTTTGASAVASTLISKELSADVVTYCGMLWRFYVRTLSLTVNMTDADFISAQAAAGSVQAVIVLQKSNGKDSESLRDGRILEESVEGGSGNEGEDNIGGEKDENGVRRLSGGLQKKILDRISEEERALKYADLTRDITDLTGLDGIPIRRGKGFVPVPDFPFGSRPIPEACVTLTAPVSMSSGQSVSPSTVPALGPAYFMNLIAPHKRNGVITEYLSLLHPLKQPIELMRSLSTLTDCIALDREWTARKSTRKILMRLFHSHIFPKKFTSWSKDMNKILLKAGSMDLQLVKKVDREATIRAWRKLESESKLIIQDRVMFNHAQKLLCRFISTGWPHCSKILQLGDPGSTSTSNSFVPTFSSSSSSSSSSVKLPRLTHIDSLRDSIMPLPLPNQVEHPSSVGGIISSLLATQLFSSTYSMDRLKSSMTETSIGKETATSSIPTEVVGINVGKANNYMPTASVAAAVAVEKVANETGDDDYIYELHHASCCERVLSGVLCSAALLDGSTSLLSLSSHSSSSSSSTENGIDDKCSYARDSESQVAVRAVTLNGLFAQKAGVPHGVSNRPILPEILTCLHRLTMCFSPLNAVHLSTCTQRRVSRQRVKESVGATNSAATGTEALRQGVGHGDAATIGASNLSELSRRDEDIFYNRQSGRNDCKTNQFVCLKQGIQLAYRKLISAWQLGINALGRYFIEESAMHGQMDSQLSSKPFSQHLSQSQSQRNRTAPSGSRSVPASERKSGNGFKSRSGCGWEDSERIGQARNRSADKKGKEGQGGMYDSQLLCTYDGESHTVLREAAESTEEILQKLFSLIIEIWQAFFSVRRLSEKSPHPPVDCIPLGAISAVERESFVESFWWLLHRVSGFCFDIGDTDWNKFIEILDPDIPVADCPATMVGAAVLLSVSHVRLFQVEEEYNQYEGRMEEVFRYSDRDVKERYESDRNTDDLNCDHSSYQDCHIDDSHIDDRKNQSADIMRTNDDKIPRTRSPTRLCCVCAERWTDSRHGEHSYSSTSVNFLSLTPLHVYDPL